MNLKTYQKKVIADLARYLELYVELQNPVKAYNAFWEEKGFPVGLNGMDPYRDILAGVPHVCAKIPTGGGKTYIAASAVKTIFDAMPMERNRARAVVWLVPSDAILTQTWNALNDVRHPYRERLDVDFSGAVQVYSKEQALTGQGLKPGDVMSNLSVFVLSYDSFRTSKKEGRKAYQQNGYLNDFAKWVQREASALLPDTDETALIQVIRSLNPVVIVDESHHAASDLSVEMLKNFNPCFVYDLTATPRKNSAVISFVDAIALKNEDMVKLPVIVYNRISQQDVYGDAITIRGKLEKHARLDEKSTGRYIRPIVLFQAQPKGTPDNTTYEKIKKTLMDAGIPEEEIAIRTGDRNELKNVDLLSRDCPIRYIITVNALKEGWDCPFAYVLATVANRTSVVDVEQILGRVLRLPETKMNPCGALNLSYVLTSSADFQQTLKQVVKGLEGAGFTDQDYRAPEPNEREPEEPYGHQISFPETMEEPDIPDVNGETLKERVESAAEEARNGEESGALSQDPLLGPALEQNAAMQAAIEKSRNDGGSTSVPDHVRERMKHFSVREAYREEAAALRIPQFMLDLRFPQFTEGSTFSLFSEEYRILEKENLEKGFTLKDKDAQVDFTTVQAEMARIDVDEDPTPKAWRLSGSESVFFREWFNAQPSEVRLSICKSKIQQRLSRRNSVNDKELGEFIDRVLSTMSEDQISEMEQSPEPYVKKIDDKVGVLLAKHRSKMFDLWRPQGKIVCRPSYKFSTEISPAKWDTHIPKSLYSAEEKVNGYEFKVIWSLSELPNIKWWHRNQSKREFAINGPVPAYPDFIVMLKSGKILAVETKGDFLEWESREKARIGDLWAQLAGDRYQYYMVFESVQPEYPGMYSQERFMEIVKGL